MTHSYDFSIEGLRPDLQLTRSTGTPLKKRGRKRAVTSPHRSQKSPNRPVETTELAVSPFTHTSKHFAPRATNRKHHQKHRQLSRLESLPPELVEHIFLQCLNVNMPRASPRLGRFLSNERMYRQFSFHIYCTNIKAGGKVCLTPPSKTKVSERDRIVKEQDAMRRTRSLGLTW